MKNNVKIIIALLLGLIIAGSIGTYATIKMQASNIEYNNGTVEEALNELYVKTTQQASNSKYDFEVSNSASAISSKITITSADNFTSFVCGVEGSTAFQSTNNICVVENLNKNTDYKITIVGMDKELRIKKKSINIRTMNNLEFNQEYLELGKTQGNVSIISNTPDSSTGLSISGSAGISGSASVAEQINANNKWYKDIDLTGFNELVFYARKASGCGNVAIAIDSNQVLYRMYSSIDTSWVRYTVDLSSYTGIHTLSIMGGYKDGSGSGTTEYYGIILQ